MGAGSELSRRCSLTVQPTQGVIPLIGLCGGTFSMARECLMTGYQACAHRTVLEAFRKGAVGVASG